MTDRAANDQRRESKLSAAGRAAAAAVFDGCDPAEVLARVERDMAAALELVARRNAAHAGLSVVRDIPTQLVPHPASVEAEQAAVAEDAQPVSALDMLSQSTRRRAA